jgi:hypothetical protein
MDEAHILKVFKQANQIRMIQIVLNSPEITESDGSMSDFSGTCSDSDEDEEKFDVLMGEPFASAAEKKAHLKRAELEKQLEDAETALGTLYQKVNKLALERDTKFSQVETIIIRLGQKQHALVKKRDQVLANNS